MSDVISPADRDLIYACMSGDVALASKALEDGADITNFRPLWMASEEGHKNVVELLLQYKANVNKTHPDFGSTPLFQASQMGHTEVVRLLLEGGADPNIAETDEGSTPLLMASSQGYYDVAMLLLNAGADPNKGNNNGDTPLYVVSRYGHADVARLLLDRGADPNMARIYDGLTPLMVAAKKGKLDMVKVLLDRGANPNGVELINGDTPLILACERRNMNMVKLLLARGADPNKGNNNGDTPLRKAEESIKLVELLLEHGADPNKGDNFGNTLLHQAIRKGRTMMVRVLLEKEADANQLNSNGRPPLHMAVKRGEGWMVQLLLEHGARVDKMIPRADGQDPEENYTALFALLLFGPTGIDNFSVSDDSALTIAQLLIAAGADTMRTTSTGFRYGVIYLASLRWFQYWQRTAEWLRSTEGLNRAEIIKSLVVSVFPAIPGDTFSLARSILASEERAALLPRTPAQIEESGRVVELCKDIRMKWAPVRHGLFHPRYRSTVMCLLMVVHRKKEVFPFEVRFIITEVPREIWFIIIEQLSREGWPSREALDFTPSRSDALPPVQKGTAITTDFTSVQGVVGVGAPRRAKGGVTDDFEVEYGQAMASTVSYVDRLLKRTPKNPSILTAARATALEISRRIEARMAAGRPPIVVECARTLLELEKRLSATERMKVADVCRNLFDTAADVMTKIHIETGTLPGDYGAEA
ncbi:MAG: ankyrin repeat domain-containing protein [Limisphaerales bacterium]